MKTNISKLYKNLFFDRALNSSEKHFYVPTYQEQIEKLRTELFFSEIESQSFYVAGQSGSGKTTALNFLPNDEILENFETLYINYRDLIAFDDADVVDVLLMFAYRMTETETSIKEKFYKKLEKIEKTYHKKIEEQTEKTKNQKTQSNVNAGVGGKVNFLTLFKAQADFFASFTMDKNIRNITREFFKFKKLDLLTLVNEIIDEWYIKKGTKKKLLVFFDDFDKLRNYEQIHSIFVDNKNFIEHIKCKKIISVPVHLATAPSFNTPTTKLFVFALKIYSNPITHTNLTTQKKIISDNKKHLIEIITKRDTDKLIEREAIELAIDFSGGILRQFLQLLREAVVNVGRLNSENITREDVQNAIDDKRKQLSLTIIGTTNIEMFKSIMENNKPLTPDNNNFVEALLNVQIILHPNNDFWYDLNPLIKKTIEIYSKDKLKL